MYDVIVIGAGASGLFCASQFPKEIKCVVLEHSNTVGKKVLMSGQGQCNFTNAINIKDFIHHYGANGRKIRSILYKYNNSMLMKDFKKMGIESYVRKDLRVFPQSLKAKDVVDALVTTCINNNVSLRLNTTITAIQTMNGGYQIETNENTYHGKYIVIATGGCSYPTTGSDDSLLPIIRKLGITWIPRKVALTPVAVEKHPYTSLSGMSFKDVSLTINQKVKYPLGDLLITHHGFSGPLILNHSRDMYKSDVISFNYLDHDSPSILIKELKNKIHTTKQQALTFMEQYFESIPKRFIRLLFQDLGIETSKKASNLKTTEIENLVKRLTKDSFIIKKLGSFHMAMVSKGGISLEEVNLRNLETKKHPNLYFIGEVLDIDGDTGGFNLQFAFSSAYVVSEDIKSKIA